MAPEPAAPFPVRWGDVLARVEQALAAALEAAAQREQALPEQPPDPAPTLGGLDEGLARFGERLRGLAECAGRAEQTVAAADADLTAGEEALREWLQAAEAARRKLADWASRA
jgi:hypothetical protein